MTADLSYHDTAETLDSDERCREYLRGVVADGDPEELAHAIGVIARARGMSAIAEAAGVSRHRLFEIVNAYGDKDEAALRDVAAALGANSSAPADAAE